MSGELFPAGDAGLADAVRFQRDLYLFWEAATRVGPSPLTARGLVARPALRRLLDGWAGSGDDAPDDASSRVAAESDNPRVFFLRRALERLGLLRLAETDGMRRLEAAETRLMARYLARSLSERVALLARLWAEGGWWPDHPERGETPGLRASSAPQTAHARRRALEAIAAAPGAVIELAHTPPALERMRRSGGLLSRSSARNRKPPARLMARTARATDEDNPLSAALSGPLTWLGLVGWDAERAVWVSRQTALALRAADDTPALALAEAHGRLVAQSDMTLIAYAPLTAPELFTLDLLATRESLEQAARYRLSRPRFAHARALGWDAAQATARLERLTGAPLPSAMRAALADWERAAARLRLTESATLLEVPSAQTLDALLADRAGAAWVMRRLAPTAALVHSDDAPHVRAWLLRHGHLPAMVDETSG